MEGSEGGVGEREEPGVIRRGGETEVWETGSGVGEGVSREEEEEEEEEEEMMMGLIEEGREKVEGRVKKEAVGC